MTGGHHVRAATRRLSIAIAMALALSLSASGLALGASSKPAVTTGSAVRLAPATATLLGKVDPNSAMTTYLFQYGPTKLYGATTAPAAAGGGSRAVDAVADLVALTPATTYHYRLVATNRNGQVKGRDRTFRTRPQPLGLTLASNPNPVGLGMPAVLAGTVTGTGNAGRQVVLQSNPFPYTQGFQPAANAQLTDAQGAFAFPLLSVPLNTQYRVLTPSRPEVVSPIVTVGVAVRVGTNVSATRVLRGRNVRFSGTVRPARVGAQIAIQKLRGTRWVTVTGTITRRGDASFSRYAKRVRIVRGGSFRVFVSNLDGNFVSNGGRIVRIRSFR